jgi:hypothetical protein
MLSGGRIEFGLADGDGNEEDHFCLLDVEKSFTICNKDAGSEDISCMVLKIYFGNGTHPGMVNLGTPLLGILLPGTINALDNYI